MLGPIRDPDILGSQDRTGCKTTTSGCTGTVPSWRRSRTCRRTSRMKALTFVTQKGGSGKSTLCISLAVAAREAGHSVCILEMDRQATVSDWLDHRTVEGPEVAQIDAAQLEPVMERLRDSAYDYVFIDTPGVDSPAPCPRSAPPTCASSPAGRPRRPARLQADARRDLPAGEEVRLRPEPDPAPLLPGARRRRRPRRPRHPAGREHRRPHGPPGRDRPRPRRHRAEPEGQAAAEVRKLWSWIERRSQNARTDKHVQAA